MAKLIRLIRKFDKNQTWTSSELTEEVIRQAYGKSNYK